MRSSFSIIGTILVSGAVAAPFTHSSQSGTYSIQWSHCSDDAPLGFDCGSMEVPLDWSIPDGKKITLRMNRIRANNSSTRIGSLILNPGGPGGSAIEICQYQAAGVQLFSDILTQHFDIVCPDPRGVGQSNPIICDESLANSGNSTLFPRTEAEFELLVSHNKAIGESCLNMTGDLVKHVDTISAAKDIEAIRLALDDGKLNYLGLSYGTQLGSQYAELFPENIRTMVLDGNLDHSQWPTNFMFTESLTYENVLQQFFTWCAANASACGFQGENLPQMFDDLVSSANQSPIPAPACAVGANTTLAGSCHETVTGQDIRVNAQDFLEFQDGLAGGLLPGWGGLGFALNQTIADKNASLLSTSFTTTNQTSNTFAATAIQCLDWLHSDVSTPGNISQAWAGLQEKYTLASIFSPHTGGACQSYTIQAICAGWPFEIVNPPRKLDQTAMAKTPKLLMVNAKHDPSTSYAWALSLHEQIPNSVLVTRDGNGHTSYFLHGEAADLMDDYFVNEKLPAEGTVVES